jgi:YegS/Rv2252/BmrU family lipid kinase
MSNKETSFDNPIFIVNPKAGKLTTHEKIKQIKACYSKKPPEFYFPKNINETEYLSKIAFKKNRLVIACGGDGIVNYVANQSIKYNGTMSILPLGRGNDFSKSIGILEPMDLKKALLKPKILNKKYLLLSFNDTRKICLTSAGVGLLSEAAFRASKIPFLQGGLLYGLSAIACFANLKAYKYSITFDGNPGIQEPLMIIVAASTPYAGGGMLIAPEAGKYKNKLNLLYAKKVSRIEAISLLKKVFPGKHLNHPKVTNMHLNNCEITTKETKFWAPLVYGDGEYLGNLPVKINIGKKPLNLMIPG